MSFDVQNFEEDVINASSVSPIVVDFWAPWCGPCRVLGPVLEKLDHESGDDWKLVKINTDQYPELSARFGIRGIPAVKMFSDGEIIAEFTGVLPEHAIKKWLGDHLPAPADSDRSEIARLLEDARLSGDFSAVLPSLEAANRNNPDDAFYARELARVLVWTDPQRSAHLMSAIDISDPDDVQLKESIMTVQRIAQVSNREVPLDEGPANEAYLAAAMATVNQDFDEAVSKYIEVIGTDRYFDDDGSRKACIALFTLLGPDHDVTKKKRRLFDMALY